MEYADVQQHLLGSCALEEIAACVATRVIGHYPRRNQVGRESKLNKMKLFAIRIKSPQIVKKDWNCELVSKNCCFSDVDRLWIYGTHKTRLGKNGKRLWNHPRASQS